MRHIGYLVLPIKIRAILARHVKCNHHHHHHTYTSESELESVYVYEFES